jgi:hypothetical protein
MGSTVTVATATVSTATIGSVSTVGDASTSTTGTPENTNDAGKTKFAKHMNADFDPYLSGFGDNIQNFMNNHFDRISTYSPFWDSMVGITGNALLRNRLGILMDGLLLILYLLMLLNLMP